MRCRSRIQNSWIELDDRHMINHWGKRGVCCYETVELSSWFTGGCMVGFHTAYSVN